MTTILLLCLQEKVHLSESFFFLSPTALADGNARNAMFLHNFRNQSTSVEDQQQKEKKKTSLYG